MSNDIEIASNSKSGLYLKIVSILVLICGLVIGLLTLAAAAGIWLGVWDFRRGFDLLRMANSYGDLVAWVGLAATVGIVLAGKLWNVGSTLKFASLAAVGTLIAGIAYTIPESFRPAEGVNYPPIHDISTNTDSPPTFVAILPLRADAPNTVVYGGSDNMTAERLAELTHEAYPDLVPRYYDAPAATIYQSALAAVDELGWELVAGDQRAGRIEATATTFWFRFKDDIVIQIESTGNQTLVNARSLSRVGTGDVGANAIRLRKFFDLL